MSQNPSSVQKSSEFPHRKTNRAGSATASVSPVRAVAMLLAAGVVRLQQRQNQLDNLTEQSVHAGVLIPKGDTA